MSFDTYGALRKVNIEVSKLIEWHVECILKKVKRNISACQAYKNPWTICITREINFSVFLQIFHAIKDFKSKFGFSCVATRNKKGEIKTIVIKFVHLGAFTHHLLQLSNSNLDIQSFFEKNCGGGNYGKVVVTGVL